MLDWHTLPLKNRDDRWMRGTELEVCFPDGFLHRFAIYSVRVLTRASDDYGKPVTEYDVKYRVRDAFTVSDAHVKAGERPAIVGEFETLDLALAFIEPARQKAA